MFYGGIIETPQAAYRRTRPGSEYEARVKEVGGGGEGGDGMWLFALENRPF